MESADVSIFLNFLHLDDPLKKHEETVDRKRAHKRSTRLTKMLRSTAAASVLEFDQTLSLRICLACTSGPEQLEISKNITSSTEKP